MNIKFFVEIRKDEDYDEDVEENLLDEVSVECSLFISKKLYSLKDVFFADGLTLSFNTFLQFFVFR